ncbi:unnamed protein product [Ascophyllum nodosum]
MTMAAIPTVASTVPWKGYDGPNGSTYYTYDESLVFDKLQELEDYEAAVENEAKVELVGLGGANGVRLLEKPPSPEVTAGALASPAETNVFFLPFAYSKEKHAIPPL